MTKRFLFTALAIVIPVVIIAIISVLSMSKTENNNIDATNTTTEVKDEEGSNMDNYTSITMDEAKEIFATPGDYVILDVRRADEFAEGHIPGAINYANEDISSKVIEGLENLDQVIYVYCRSGRRSKEAASKMVLIGYTNVIECGGIIDWTGDIEK